MMRKVCTLAQPLNYYPLWIFQVVSNEIAIKSPRTSKRDFRALWRLVKGSETQSCSLLFQLQGMTLEEAGRPSRYIPGSVTGITSKILWYFCHGSVYKTPCLLATDGIHLSRRGKDLCSWFSKAHWNNFELDLKRERDKIRLDRDKPGDNANRQCAIEVSWSAPLCAEYTGAHLKCPWFNVLRTLAISWK